MGTTPHLAILSGSIHISRMEHGHHERKHDGDGQLAQAVLRLAHELHELHKQIRTIMTALETVTASVNANTSADAELTVAVNAAIVQLGKASPTDAQLLTLAGQIDANTATTAAQTAAINAALSTPPPVEPPVV